MEAGNHSVEAITENVPLRLIITPRRGMRRKRYNSTHS